MKNSKKATSIAEAMIVMLIIVTWVTWMYKIYDESINLSYSITNKIQAIQIAKQGIEWFTNIRDTNWLIFSSDYDNCWNSLNYDSSCIWDNSSTSKIKEWWKYILYRQIDNRWTLSEPSVLIWSYDINNQNYRDNYRVWLKDWIYTQSWSNQDIIPFFTRRIETSYPETWNTTDKKIKILSIVEWVNNKSKVASKIELEQVLTNWKK